MVPKKKTEAVTISPPNIHSVRLRIEGTAPYAQLRFSEKAEKQMAEKMMAGPTAKKGKAKEARDFDEDFRQAQHISEDGWIGIPASAFRIAMVDACRLVGFRMTLAKLSLFARSDGVDKLDGLPLIRIEGDPEPNRMHVRNANGVADLRVRAMWRKWSANVDIEYDADQFKLSDVVNLMARVGRQVGIGEGRPNSKQSTGLGWGTFEIVNETEVFDGK